MLDIACMTMAQHQTTTIREGNHKRAQQHTGYPNLFPPSPSPTPKHTITITSRGVWLGRVGIAARGTGPPRSSLLAPMSGDGGRVGSCAGTLAVALDVSAACRIVSYDIKT